MNHSNRKAVKKNELLYKILSYIIICFVTFLSLIFKRIEVNLTSLFQVVGFSSGLYVALYLGLKGGALRLRKGIKFKKHMDKLYLSSRAIILHICIAILSIVFAVLFGVNSSTSPIVDSKEVGEKTLLKIEEKLHRRDIVSIIECNDSYIVKLSDNSIEVIKLEK